MFRIIFVILAIIIFVIMVVIVLKANKKFHDKSLDVKKGMDEVTVREIMDKDPTDIEYLENESYALVYERDYYKGWGMVNVKTRIIFNSEHKVISIKHEEEIKK